MKRIVECLLEAGIMEKDIHRILDLIEEEYEVVDEAREADINMSVFPKKALANANKKYEDADKEAILTKRIAKTALKKLNKKIKHLKNVGWNEDDILSNTAHSQEGTRYENAKQAALDADKKVSKLERKQEDLIKQGTSGVLHRPVEMHRTKKGDNYSFHKGHIQTSK